MAGSENRDCVTLTGTFSKDVQTVPIRSFDQKLRHLNQFGDSLQKIQELVQPGSSGISIYPRMVREAGSSAVYDLLQTRLQEDLSSGFAYLGTNMAVTCNITVTTRPPQNELLLDVCLFVRNKPAYVISITNNAQGGDMRRYNLSLATGVIKAVRRFTDVKFSALYGLMTTEDLQTQETFKTALIRIKSKTQKLSIAASLTMSDEKHKKVVKAFLCSVATTNTVSYHSPTDALWVLTPEQFCILSENIDRQEIRVVAEPSSGSTVLMFELAQRLEKSAPTMLLLYSEKEIEYAKNKKLCTEMLTNQELHRRLAKGIFHKINHVVTNTMFDKIQDNFGNGSVWYFSESKDSVREESCALLKLKAKTHEDVKNYTKQMLLTPAVDVIMKKFENGQRWVTVTGAVGTGKTTLGFMVLKEIEKKAFDVFTVQTPEEYHLACESKQKCVVMMNNVLGTYKLDTHALQHWRPILNEHMAMLDDAGKSNVHVLFLANKIILQEANNRGFGVGCFVADDDKIMDLSHEEFMPKERKLEMLNYLLQLHEIDVDDNIKKEVSTLQMSHGFLHCCNMYVWLRKKDLLQDDHMSFFFRTPFQFIKLIINMFVNMKEEKSLLKNIVEKGGKMQIPTDAASQKPLDSLMSGFLLKCEDGMVTFSHQSLLPQVIAALCRSDPSFLVENCISPLFLERVRVDTSTHGSSDNADTICIPAVVRNDVVRKLAQAIRSKMYTLFEHEIFKDDSFCQDTVRTVIDKELTMSSLDCQEHEFDIDTKNEEGETLLHVTARYQNKTAVEVLLQHGADVSLLSKKKLQTPLHTVSQSETVDVSIMERLIQNGASVNSQDLLQRTALHYLCDQQTIDDEAMTVLIDHDADVSVADMFEKLPLHVACKTARNLDENKLKRLIAKDVSLGDRYKKTALHYLCDGVVQTDLIKHLITVGADVNAEDEWANTPLHYLCQNEKPNLANKNERAYHDCMDLLVKNGSIINKPNRKGKTPLHILCGRVSSSNVESLKYILSMAADVKLCDEPGSTALHYLTKRGETNVEAVKLLFQFGAKSVINEVDKSKLTPLHNVIYKVKIDHEVLNILLTAGADVNLAGPSGNSPFHIACKKQEVDIDLIKILLPACDINKTGENAQTPLHMLCARERVSVDAVSLVLDHRADSSMADYMGSTALHYLCVNSTLEAVKKVITDKNINQGLTHGTDPEENRGQTALHLACITEKADSAVIKELLERKASIFSTDCRGRTPLHYICQGSRKFTFFDQMMKWKEHCNDQTLDDVDLRQRQTEIATLLLDKRRGRQRRVDESNPSSSGYSSESSTDANQTLTEHKGPLVNKEYANMTDNDDRTALHYLCMRNSKVVARSLFEKLLKGADVEKSDVFGMSILHYLVLNGAHELMEILFTHRLDSNKTIGTIRRNEKGSDEIIKSPELNSLQLADSAEGPVEKQVIERRTSENPILLTGMTALHLACLTTKADINVVKLLVNQGADVNKVDNKGRTALHLICEDPHGFSLNYKTNEFSEVLEPKFDDKIEEERYAIMKILLHHERRKVDERGIQALHGKFQKKYEGEAR